METGPDPRLRAIIDAAMRADDDRRWARVQSERPDMFDDGEPTEMSRRIVDAGYLAVEAGELENDGDLDQAIEKLDRALNGLRVARDELIERRDAESRPT